LARYRSDGGCTLLLVRGLGGRKQCIGEKLGARATYGELQNVLCAILTGAVLVGLAANTLFGLWWLDPIIALVISAACVREGLAGKSAGALRTPNPPSPKSCASARPVPRVKV
jgi:hypothetical protein